MHVGLRGVCCCCTMIPDNDINVEGAKALAPALGYLTQLTELDMSGEFFMGVNARVGGTCVFDVVSR